MMEPSEISEDNSSELCKNVFCNPAFEPENDRDEVKDSFKVDVPPQPSKGPSTRRGVLSLCVVRLRGSWCGWSAVVVSAAVLLLVTALGLTLALTLTQLNSESTEGGMPSPLDSWNGDGVPHSLHPLHSTVVPQPEREPTSPTKCGGVLTDTEGTLSSPNHPGLYPPDSVCVWVISVPPPSLVQIHVSSLGIEGPSPCLFDWLEVREEAEQMSTRFCGNVAPPTVNTNSSVVWITFHSDASIGGNGFSAQYTAISPGQKSCTREEFMCDSGRCLLPVSVCDGQPNCQDHTDEANCSHKHKECGGQKRGPHGSFSSPNHPKPYPHQQLCKWHISVEEGYVIKLSFQNFSLETQDVCEFDYVEVHDSGDTGDGSVLGRYCGSGLPPDLTSSGPIMTVLFVADEGVADSGFFASYQAISILDRTCSPTQFACGSGECVNQDWLCDGWNDCADGADEHDCSNSTYPPFTSSCEPIHVDMCQGLSYNLTSFPNIWLSIADQREAASMLSQYKVLMDLACFEPLRRLVCGIFVPQCSPQGGVLQPCRSICSSAEQQCSQALDLFSLSWPFNCHLLPDTQDPMECSLP
ncbi:membrane frizzled-related protein [Chanos chanos]|uniref:Membrane frizzled-related protein n=1 Tax=Chanos chanos TaxID=29144 RepID=A0A6J2VR84_CHACN|nr:membrane frizzled-related protein [Chanos chanos]